MRPPWCSKIQIENHACDCHYTSKQVSRVLGLICGVAPIFCVYKGNSPKYRGKYAIASFLLSFMTGSLNQLDSFFDAIQLYGYMATRPYGYVAKLINGIEYGGLLKQQ
jgi:hypothetical protein